MIDDAVFLARIQFAFTMAFHIIFPSFTIGLVAWIATLEAMWLSTGRERYYLLARFWTKIFAISFAMGVVSGLVMSYQLGTNWSRYSRIIGNIIGPMIGYEVVWAFFLEALKTAIYRIPQAYAIFDTAVARAATRMIDCANSAASCGGRSCPMPSMILILASAIFRCRSCAAATRTRGSSLCRG